MTDTVQPFNPYLDPDETLDFIWDWSKRFAPGETISGDVTWIVPGGITKQDQTQTTTAATIWLTGGTIDQDYDITCRVATNQGRTMDYTKMIRCRAK